MGNVRYQRDGRASTSGPGFGVTLHEDKLLEPFRWRRPTTVFVNSMSDLFHVEIPRDFIVKVFATMGRTRQHTYQVLTKRPGRMRMLLADPSFEREVQQLVWNGDTRGEWPLPNVWLGVSVEDQQRAENRIPALLRTPAAIRFLSCEPLLETIDLSRWLHGIDWLICGGESGPGARPMDEQWVRSLRNACARAGIAFFLKQWGGRTPKAGGRELDGQTYDEMPIRRAAASLRDAQQDRSPCCALVT